MCLAHARCICRIAAREPRLQGSNGSHDQSQSRRNSIPDESSQSPIGAIAPGSRTRTLERVTSNPNQISAVLWPQACAPPGSLFRRPQASTRGCECPERLAVVRRAAGGPEQQLREAALAERPEAPRSGAGSRGRAPDATMGKGSMGAVDKNMRKELSLEIDGHACPDQYVNVGIGAEITWRAPHAVDATLIPWPPRNSLVDCHTGLHAPRVRRNRGLV